MAIAFMLSPLPPTLSEAGRAAVTEHLRSGQPQDPDVAARRRLMDAYQAEFGAKQRQRCAVEIADDEIAGVPVRRIRAPGAAPADDGPVLLNLHGGGFSTDSGSLTENIPVAALTGVPVVAVLYRLAPEHPFPAAVDDALAVYRELLKTRSPSQVGLYGTSAGAILGPQLIVRLQREGLPMPAFLGVFSGDADLSRKGDSLWMLPFDVSRMYQGYLGATALTDPAASPVLGPLDAFPPTLCMTSSRDFYLSGTANLARQLELAGAPSSLIVFDGLPHAFWAYLETPESDEAFAIMARFMTEHLAPPPRG
jgi:acetyl esterase/lipase